MCFNSSLNSSVA